MYTAVVLDQKSRYQLLAHLAGTIPDGWELIAHHVTIKMGLVENVEIGESVDLIVKSYAMDNRVMAVAVEGNIPCENKIKHITIAVNRAAGGKPVHSNYLINWIPLSELIVTGVIQEVE